MVCVHRPPQSRATPARAAALLVGCALFAPGCDRSGGTGGTGGTGRGVLVIAIDGLRADHVGCYGHDRPTTPALDALFADGVRFEEAFATAPTLLPSHVSLFTGCDPNVARRTQLLNEMEASVDERWRVPRNVPHLAVEMLVQGFETAAFIDHGNLSPGFGFAPGFQRYLSTEEEPFTPAEELGLAAGAAKLRQWLRSLERSKPWFAYLHAHDLERVWSRPDPRWESYFTPRPELERIPPVGNTDDVFFAIPRSRWREGARTLGYYEALYDGHVRRLDEDIEQLVRALRVEGRYQNTTIVVVGTHGVQFGEAGMILSSGRYSLADVRVPWIMRSPLIPAERKGAVVEGVASLLDVVPTLLEVIRVDRPRGMHGISQLSAIQGEVETSPREYAFTSCGVQGGGAVFGRRWTLEYNQVGGLAGESSWYGDQLRHIGGSFAFYDRVEMPYPPLFGSAGTPPAEVARGLESAGTMWDFNMNRTRKVLQGGTLLYDPRRDVETVNELRALGYLGDDL